MAGYPKIWTFIRHEHWFKKLKANERGAVLEMILMVKEQQDNGHLVVNSMTVLAYELSINRKTLGKLVVKLTQGSAPPLVIITQQPLDLYFPKYMKWQNMTVKEAVKHIQDAGSKMTTYQPNQPVPNQTRPEQAPPVVKTPPPIPKPEIEEPPFDEIITDLNLVTKRTGRQKLRLGDKVEGDIRARFKEGYKLEDFKHVHRVKTQDWIGTEYEKFLTPETLYRPTKFPKYAAQQFPTEKQTLLNKHGEATLEAGRRVLEKMACKNKNESKLLE